MCVCVCVCVYIYICIFILDQWRIQEILSSNSSPLGFYSRESVNISTGILNSPQAVENQESPDRLS